MGLEIDLNLAAEEDDNYNEDDMDDDNYNEDGMNDDNYNEDGVGEECGHSNGGESSINMKKNSEPYVGMEFDSDGIAQSFYLEYAKMTGFAASKIACCRSKVTKEWVEAKYACTRFGTKRKTDSCNPRPCMKIDCKAMLHVKRRQDGKWAVQNFVKEHNHELSPEDVHYFPCYRNIASGDLNNISTLHSVGVKPSKIFAALAKQCGGYQNIGFLQKDMRNFLDKKRRLELESGDAKAMLEHFTSMQEENPNFFYAMDLDEEQRLRNVFWVDAKGREDYKIFGDVVSFDTTDITNKYKMPFAPFIGVNNHFQSTLLGCALLADETTSTFIWLMETWVRAMGGRAPTAILTDQDQAMKAAIAKVFPNARHRFCLWHILKKLPEKLGSFLKENENFMPVFNDCIYHSWTEEDFENKWQSMIEIFNLGDDDWLQSLFRDRKQWVPTYMRDTFFVGMSTTQRSESINSFFDKYVNKKTSLKEFVEQYKEAAQDRLEVEVQADFNNLHKLPSLKSPSPFGYQMSKIYTLEIFKRFEEEVLGISACNPIKQKEDPMTMTFRVQDFGMKEEFIVAVDGSTGDVSCLCRLLEYKGFLCRHAMAILQNFGSFCIPDQYILQRWRKDVKTRHTTRETKVVDPKIRRFNDLFQKYKKVCEEGSLSDQKYDMAKHLLEEALRQCGSISHSINVNKEMVKNIDKENVNNKVSCDIHILDPKVSSTKGAPKRIRSGVEISSRNGNKRSRKAQENLEIPKDKTKNTLQKVHEKVGDTNFDNNESTQDCLQDIGNTLD